MVFFNAATQEETDKRPRQNNDRNHIMNQQGNLFSAVPDAISAEAFESLVAVEGVTIERIVSQGQVTPEGQWYDQPQAEWVVLLQGQAKVLFEGEDTARVLKAGDWLNIPAGRRHRVTYTSSEPMCVWLAVHYTGNKPAK